MSARPIKARCEYKYSKRFGQPKHTWSAVSAKAGVHLHIHGYMDSDQVLQYSGGIEIHYRQPPEYMENDPPTHDECWLLKSPCWHDGSSLQATLQATEFWIPKWLADPHDHEGMFDLLTGDLVGRIEDMAEV